MYNIYTNLYVYLCAMMDVESFSAQHYLILPLWQKLILIGRFPFFKFKYKRYILSHLCSRFISPSLWSQHYTKTFPFLFQHNSFFRLPFTSKLQLPLHITLNNIPFFFSLFFKFVPETFSFFLSYIKYIKHIASNLYIKLPWQQTECHVLYVLCSMLYFFLNVEINK